jgi:hypothetical protein
MTPAFKKLYNLVKTNSGTVFNSSWNMCSASRSPHHESATSSAL